MEYRKFGDAYYIRMDRGDEMVSCVMEVCQREGIASATYSGIGGCGAAELQMFDPQKRAFSTHRLEGLLELIAFNGNVISDEGGARHTHTHALFAYAEGNENRTCGGHIKSATVRYTAEIELRPVLGGAIGYKLDPETGTGFWAL